MKILLLGKNGQLGWELQRALAPLGVVVALGRGERELCGDLYDLEGLTRTVRTVQPDVIVNAAAWTDVDLAESEKDKVYRVNSEAPAVLAREAHALGAWLVHYSSDYVFSGAGQRPWTEEDAVAPLNVYGASKHKGELAIAQSGCRYLVFRSSWLYAARGKNFLRTLLCLVRERNEISVVCDQVGAPTSAELVADVTAHALREVWQRGKDSRELSGIYHVAAAGAASWFDYASLIVDEARRYGERLAVEKLVPIGSGEWPALAKRPMNSRLNTAKVERVFNVQLPAWQDGVRRVVAELMESRT